jgi:hypothetical protein
MVTKRIRDIGARCQRVRDVGAHLPLLDPAMVAAALGAELVGKRDQGGSPLALFITRRGMAEALQPSASAPAGGNSTAHANISLANQE